MKKKRMHEAWKLCLKCPASLACITTVVNYYHDYNFYGDRVLVVLEMSSSGSPPRISHFRVSESCPGFQNKYERLNSSPKYAIDRGPHD